MINVVEKLNKSLSYSWGMLHPGDVIQDTAWKTEGDYAFVVSRHEEEIIIYRFKLGATQSLRPTDCAGHSFYKYDADLVITRRV